MELGIRFGLSGHQGLKATMERFDKILQGHDQATKDLFHFGNFAWRFELTRETTPKMQAAE